MSRKMQDAAERYAAADKSDPFTLARCQAHIRNGVASLYTQGGQEAFYNAEEAQEMRKMPDGSEYPVTVYRNIIRP